MDPSCRGGKGTGKVMADRDAGSIDRQSVEIETSCGVIRGQQCRGVSPPLHGIKKVKSSRGFGGPWSTVIKDGESTLGGRRSILAATHNRSEEHTSELQ